MKILRTYIIFVGLVSLAYPIFAFGQTTASDPTQLATDQAACQQHAVAYSGYNPAVPPAQQTSSPTAKRGAGLRGAARGAAKGAVAGGIVEEVGGDNNRAVETGTALGAARGASQGVRASRTQAATAPPPPTGDPNAYAKSYDDCMSGKGHAKQ